MILPHDHNLEESLKTIIAHVKLTWMIIFRSWSIGNFQNLYLVILECTYMYCIMNQIILRCAYIVINVYSFMNIFIYVGILECKDTFMSLIIESCDAWIKVHEFVHNTLNLFIQVFIKFICVLNNLSYIKKSSKECFAVENHFSTILNSLKSTP